MTDARLEVAASTVRELIAAQFPKWSHLEVRPVEPGGWDNRTFHLGAEMTVRLPSAARYEAQVEKEHRWLPFLARHLPARVPHSIAIGEPGCGYPWNWSVRAWIEGVDASRAPIEDADALALDVARFLTAIWKIDTADGPAPGAHNFHRGGPPDVYDGETRAALEALRRRGNSIDTTAARKLWERALTAKSGGDPVWIHGDLAANNLLVRNGRLHAVIDFGGCATGDPACDLTIAWTFFAGNSREKFRSAVPADQEMWARARGWALWKALITIAGLIEADAATVSLASRVVNELLAEVSSQPRGQRNTPTPGG